MELTPREHEEEPDDEGITRGMREEAQRLSASLAEQAVRTSQQAERKFAEFEMAIEREQEIYAAKENDHSKAVHAALESIRSAINVILEDDSGRG